MQQLTQEEEKAIEASATSFAAITHTAREFAQVMSQSFEIRIKSGLSSYEFRMLSICFVTLNKIDVAKLLGKTLTVKVDWSMIGCNMHLKVQGSDILILLDEEEVTKYITNIGLAKKMLDMWLLVKKGKTNQSK